MIFILISGFLTPIDSMPDWAPILAYTNPVTYFVEVLRSIVIKGSLSYKRAVFYHVRFCHNDKYMGYIKLQKDRLVFLCPIC